MDIGALAEKSREKAGRKAEASPCPELQQMRHEDLLWLLGSLSQLHRLPFDAGLIAQQFPPPHNLAAFHEAARSLGFTTGGCRVAGANWRKLPLPMVGFLRAEDGPAAPEGEAGEADSEPPAEGGAAPPTAILIVKVDEGKLLYFRAGSQAPETLPVVEAADRLAPGLVLMALHGTTASGPGGEIPGFVIAKKEFGFRWFVPELLKHKRIWRDVLTASLAIQLVGLATPIFTQVIIDKVVAHQTRSTLIVLGVAMVMFMLFSSVMSWLRQYLVLHTGNRIDAVLGSQVFRHMLRLPLPYFEHRPTGTLIARLQGVETIRQFVSGAAVTLLLDLPFLFIFLAVMFAYSWQLSLIAVGLMTLICLMSLMMVPSSGKNSIASSCWAPATRRSSPSTSPAWIR